MALTRDAMVALEARLGEVRRRIEEACRVAGRDPATVRLLAVSKHHPAETIRAAYGLGQREFGENYVQELSAKAEELADLPDLDLRFIGHLQRNKARDIARLSCSVDTVDSIALGEELAKRAKAQGKSIEVLIQVNVGREAQKAGVLPESVAVLVEQLRALPTLSVEGLLAIPPVRENAEDSRADFRKLAELAKEHGLRELSMGMSDDLEVAIEEGSTMVRVGTAIFGPRPAKPDLQT